MEIKRNWNDQDEMIGYSLEMSTEELVRMFSLLRDVMSTIETSEETNNGYWIDQHFVTRSNKNDYSKIYKTFEDFLK